MAAGDRETHDWTQAVEWKWNFETHSGQDVWGDRNGGFRDTCDYGHSDTLWMLALLPVMGNVGTELPG